MKELIFYDIMWYNYPYDKEYFFIHKNLTSHIKNNPKKEKKLNSNTKEQEDIINKYSFLFKTIPFIEEVYISNSLTFKSINKKSDIDLFIITQNNKIFLAKFFTYIFLKIFKLYWNHENNKFCTWFFITSQSKDLYPLSISPVDIYLAYWIAHLQNIYLSDKKQNNNFFKENIWVKNIIPNYSIEEHKILNLKKQFGKNFLKTILEKIFGQNFLNNIIWFVRKIKIKKNKTKSMIISNNILKFHSPDIRKIVYLKYKSLKNTKKFWKKNQENLF